MSATLTVDTLHVSSFPLVVGADQPGDFKHFSLDDVKNWLRERNGWISEKLLVHGALLLRGLPLASAEAFHAAAQELLGSLVPYIEGQSPRTKVGDNVYTSTEYPSQFSITLHNELSYVKEPPQRILFFCLSEPTTGGETPIVDGRRAYSVMPASLRHKFESLGVLYVKNMHGDPRGFGKSWMDHFETHDRATVEAYLKSNGISFEWRSNGALRTMVRRPGTLDHPKTGEAVWFNQAHLWHVSNFEPKHREQLVRLHGEENLPTHAYFGDGSPMDVSELDVVRKVLWDCAASYPWRQSDLLVADNILTMHGRNPFTGPRKILVAMG
jgi:alpha-ketoglutarate-dependent taurine dioxygenase